MEKKIIGKLCLSSLLVLGVGCSNVSGNDNQGKSSSKAENESSSSSEISGESWSKEQEELLKAYCGEAIPFPEYCLDGEITFEEISDSDGSSYLQIRDQAESFTLLPYFMDLQEAKWNVVCDYSGKAVQTNSSGVQYVEATKPSTDGQVGYDMFYFYSSSYTDSDGETVEGGNVLRCFKDLSGSLTEDSSWNEAISGTMKDVLTCDLPFIKLSPNQIAQQTSINSMQIADDYAKDLTRDYVAILEKDGFKIDEELSEAYNSYVVTKTLSDGAIIDLLLSYYGGNTITAYYTPSETSYASWDNALIKEVKEKTGISVPSFGTEEGKGYKGYKKNDDYFIYTLDLLDGFDYTTYTYGTLKDPHLTWNETLSFTSIALTGDDGETMIGYMLWIKPISPSSTFVSSWPSEVVSSTVSTTLGIEGITLPSLADEDIPSSGEKLKYEVRGEDYYKEAYAYYCKDIKENPDDYFSGKPTEKEILGKAEMLAKEGMGVTVSFVDLDLKGAKAYEKALYEMSWYSYQDSDDNLVYENPEGKLAVTFVTDIYTIGDLGTTAITFHSGSGNPHEAVFEFLDDKVGIAPGNSKTLELIKSMLPYEVTFTVEGGEGKITVDEDGYVSVAEDAEIGTTATIKATINIPGEGEKSVTCTITVKKDLNYSSEKAINTVAAALKKKGYNVAPAQDDYDETKYSFTLNLSDSTTEAQAKELVTTALIPEGFYHFPPNEATWDSWTEDGRASQRAVYCVDNDDGSFIMLKFHVYQENGSTFLYVIAE